MVGPPNNEKNDFLAPPLGVNKLIHDEALNGEQVKFVRTQQRRSSMLFVQCTQET